MALFHKDKIANYQRVRPNPPLPCENRVKREHANRPGPAAMTPEEFIAKWRGNMRSERAASQPHFLDLCDLLGVEKPGGRGRR
jgi:hypothetical protein